MKIKPKTYLSLFSGVEGGGLAFQHLIKPKITCIGYVENDDYCQKVIKQRQIDGLLDKAPIYGDIRIFIDSGCAELYKGITDVVTAGFPCPLWSAANQTKTRGDEADERNLWPKTIECINKIRPKYTLLENVPNLLAHEYSRKIFGDMAESGYSCRHGIFSASKLGFPHQRKRLWFVNTDSECMGWEAGAFVKQAIQRPKVQTPDIFSYMGKERNWRETATRICRTYNGMANRMDRLKAVGNGQVPQVAALAWETLNN